MKKHLLILSVLVLSLSIALVAFAALKGNKIELKVGDEVYACAAAQTAIATPSQDSPVNAAAAMIS